MSSSINSGDVSVNINQITTDLNSKADRDLVNLSDTGKINGSSFPLPGKKFINLVVNGNGTLYTAPANGWFNLKATASSNASSGVIKFTNTSTTDSAAYNCFQTGQTLSADDGGAIFIPVVKGDKVRLEWSVTLSTSVFTFHYAQGSESEAS